MIILTCDNVSLTNTYGKIISNLGFSLGPGSIIALTGKNGIGKTSLLMAIAGVNTPHQGSITIDSDRPYKIHFIGNNPIARPELTVEENLEFIANLHDTYECVPAAIRYFALDLYMESKITTLSSGWQKRVELAGLLISNADIWLLDEPETHLDANAIELLNQLITVRTSQGGIVLWATNQSTTHPQINLKDFAV